MPDGDGLATVPLMADPAAGPSDNELLRAHVAGDRRAFEELFRRHRTRLYRKARHTGQSAADAEDAVQEAMLSAFRGAGGFRRDAAVGSWLHRIVVNACRDRHRHNAIRPTIALEDEYVGPTRDRTDQVDTAIEVRRALMALPPGQRAAVLAVDLHGYSVAEAAVLLGVAEGTVKSRRARARARLAVLLDGPDSR